MSRDRPGVSGDTPHRAGLREPACGDAVAYELASEQRIAAGQPRQHLDQVGVALPAHSASSRSPRSWSARAETLMRIAASLWSSA